MRLINADSLETHEIYEGEWKMVVYADDIDDAPTIEAVEVVRCKDCKHFTKPYELRHYPLGICNEWNRTTYPDGYCSYAERRKK